MNKLTITLDQLKQILKSNPAPQDWLQSLNTLLPQYGVTTPKRLAMFFAQTCHESRDFTALQENLKYSKDRLLVVFKRYFNPQTAEKYAYDEKAIANLVYANRLGNGPQLSGDGFAFKGRGLIQITGKDNYSKFAKHIGKSLPETIQYIQSKDGALHSALWFWKINNLNGLADHSDVAKVTKIINGGSNGLQDRMYKFNTFLNVLK